MEQVTSHEPRPPRQHDDSIPKELDRICLKALSKRASERYSRLGTWPTICGIFWPGRP